MLLTHDFASFREHSQSIFIIPGGIFTTYRPELKMAAIDLCSAGGIFHIAPRSRPVNRDSKKYRSEDSSWVNRGNPLIYRAIYNNSLSANFSASRFGKLFTYRPQINGLSTT